MKRWAKITITAEQLRESRQSGAFLKAMQEEWERNARYFKFMEEKYLRGGQWTCYPEWEDQDLFIDIGL